MTTTLVLLRLLVVLGVLRALGLPLARMAFPRLPVAAYALATTVALVVSAHATWLLAQAGARIGALAIASGLAATAIASFLAGRHLRASGERILPTLRQAAAVHAVFALAFLLALGVVARNPSVDPDSERFMDYAMVNAVLASRTLPLEDPWFAGERVSYYDYGYYATAHLALLVGPAERFFPIAIALVYAALFTGVTALGLDLAGRMGGLLAGFLVCLAGNLDALVQVASGRGAGIDWFKSARVVDGAITEFPFFTLLWGDLHPYGLALPLWPLLLAVAATLLRAAVLSAPAGSEAAGAGAGRRVLWTVAIGAVGYAALVATHTWDAVPVAALLAFLSLRALLLGRAGADRARLTAAIGAPLAVVALGALLALPFLAHAPTGGRGLDWVLSRSTLGELAIAWGGPAVLLLACGILEIARRPGWRDLIPAAAVAAGIVIVSFPQPGIGLAACAAATALALGLSAACDARAFVWLLAAVGGGLVAGVELLHVDDFYGGELERMNTVFKAYVEAWVLLSLAAALATPRLLAAARGATGSLRRAFRGALAYGLLLAVIAATAVYPVLGTRARCGSLLQPLGLDARIAFLGAYPDDAAAAEALRSQPYGRVLETTGDPYSWNGRFATFTGFPAVVGWAHHEAGWRNDWKLPMERASEVREAYSDQSPDKLRALVLRHKVDYLVVGELERAQYPAASLEKFTRLEPVVRAGQTVVYRVGDLR